MELKREVLAIIQARYNSTRFPGKVVKKINNQTILEILIKRLSKSKCISKIIVACSKNHDDKEIINICKKLRINYFTGSEIDVLGRFYNAAKKYKASSVVRITADCPLIDPEIVDEVINRIGEYGEEYVRAIEELNSKFPSTKYRRIENPREPQIPSGVRLRSTVYPNR